MTKRDWIVIALWTVMVIAILSFMTVKVFAHHQGTTHRHHCGEDTWNWHRHATSDLNTRRMHMSCGGLTVEEMERVEARKGKTSPCLRLARTLGITTGYIPDVEHTSTPAGPSMINTPCGEDEPPEEDPPMKKPPVYVPPRGNSPSDNLQGELDEVLDDEPVIPEDVDIEEIELPEPTAERERYVYRFHQGWNFKVFVVVPEGVETLSGLYRYLDNTHWEVTLIVLVNGHWLLYRGEGETGDIPINGNMGIAVHTTHGFTVVMNGYRLATKDWIDVSPGANFIGFPILPDRYERPSDILSEQVIVVMREIEGTFYSIGRAGDSGDEAIEDGEAVLVFATGATQAAPQAQRYNTLTTSWGAIKQER